MPVIRKGIQSVADAARCTRDVWTLIGSWQTGGRRSEFQTKPAALRLKNRRAAVSNGQVIVVRWWTRQTVRRKGWDASSRTRHWGSPSMPRRAGYRTRAAQSDLGFQKSE